jgi:ATP-dependent DNA helicase RecQ
MGWRSTGAPWEFDAERYAALAAARATEAGIMRSYAAGAGCLMSFLRLSLDDPHAGEACGVCSVCTGSLPAGLSPTPTASDVEGARAFARGVDVVIEPRKLWPAGTAWKGRISSALGEGRALAFADDPGWSELVVRLTREGAADTELPPEVAAGVVELLARWARRWPQRPTTVVPIPSRTRPKLIGSLARHIVDVGKLELLEAFELDGPRPIGGVASGQRVAAVSASLRLVAGADIPAGPILLVDDIYTSGWTMTVAATLLADGGASAVYPLVLHRRP